MILTEETFLDKGAFGHVYRVGRYAIKLFLKPPGPEFDVTAAELEEDRRRVFEAERDGYLLATRTPELSAHVPGFYGTIVIEDVIGSTEHSDGKRFLLGCAYVMDFIDGQAEDVLPHDQPNHVAELVERMHAAGIRRTDDMIGWRLGSASDFILADFATYDAADYRNCERQGIVQDQPPSSPMPHGSHEADQFPVWEE